MTPLRPAWPDITVINRSPLLHGMDVTPVVAAVQVQITRDFLPHWHLGARLHVSPSHHIGARAPANHWAIVLLDDADQADAEGYHELTTDGQPLAKVFVKTSIKAGDNWTVTLSHEALEMLADPNIDQIQTSADGTVYAREVCDAVEGESYDISGVAVSDFQLPSWFGMASGDVVAYDQMGRCNEAWQILPGGYMSVMRGGSWTEIFGSSKAQRHFLAVGKHRPVTRRTVPDTRRRSLA